MSDVEESIKELKVALLQLQRSVLIDTQTILQILLNKGLCNLEDLTHVRNYIEKENIAVQQLNQSIQSLGGSLDQVNNVPQSTSNPETASKMQELQELIQQLVEVNSKSNLE